LIFCLFAAAEKNDIEEIGTSSISVQDRPDMKQQIAEEIDSIPQVNASELTQSVVRAGAEINWQVISTGGNKSISTGYILNGTIGQTAIYSSVSGNYDLIHGYWQRFEISGSCDCEPGECDGVPPLNILDIVYLIDYKYKEGSEPIPHPICSGDPYLDCTVNILDIVYLINFKYKNGPPPGSCRDWVMECGLPIRN